jgi:hypothetical protein
VTVRQTAPVLEMSRLRSELDAACADADVEVASVVVYVVASRQPEGTTPLAYLNPAGVVRADTVSVFRAVGSARAARYAGTAHRLAVWRELPEFPAAALGPMLRHELEHARRFERSGPAFFEADDLLRAAVRAAGGHGYARLPSELEANAASATYAARMLTPAELGELRAVPECAALLDGAEPPEDVVEMTLALLDSPRAVEMRAEFAAWDGGAWRRAAFTAGPLIDLV